MSVLPHSARKLQIHVLNHGPNATHVALVVDRSFWVEIAEEVVLVLAVGRSFHHVLIVLTDLRKEAPLVTGSGTLLAKLLQLLDYFVILLVKLLL